MAIPDFQSIMLPLLKLSADQKEHSVRETEERLADDMKLTKEDREEILPSGTQRRFVNRVAWAKIYLSKAGLLMSPRRSVYKITQRGLDVLKENPPVINVAYLKRFEEILDFIKPSKEKDSTEAIPLAESSTTPRETLEAAYRYNKK